MPIENGKYVNPGWVDNAPPAIDATELNAISDTLENLDNADPVSYTAGNGVSILNSQISARMSSQSGNTATFGSDGGIYVPQSTSYTLPPATSNSLGGIKVGEGLSVTGDGTLSVSGGGGNLPYKDVTVSGDFNGQTSIVVSILSPQDGMFGRPFLSVYAMTSNMGQAGVSTMGCTFGGYPILPELPIQTRSSQQSTAAFYYKAYQQNPGYYVVGVDGFYTAAGRFTFTSSTGQGSYILRVVGFGPNINNS